MINLFAFLDPYIESLLLTLKWVEDGEKVHEGQVDRAPGKEGKAPRHTKKEGQADHTTQVTKDLLSQCSVATLTIATTNLDHHNDEHGHIHEEDDGEVTHTCHIEHHVASDPATMEKEHL